MPQLTQPRSLLSSGTICAGMFLAGILIGCQKPQESAEAQSGAVADPQRATADGSSPAGDSRTAEAITPDADPSPAAEATSPAANGTTDSGPAESADAPVADDLAASSLRVAQQNARPESAKEKDEPIHPDDKSTPDDREAARKLVDRAIAAANKGDRQLAHDEFKQALQKWPYYREGYNNYLQFMLMGGQLMDASQLAPEMIEKWPNDADIRSDYGVVLVRNGAPEAALPQFREAIKLSPMHANANYNQGLVLLQGLGSLDEAIELFHNAIKAQPDYDDAYFGLGRAYFRMGEYDRAIEQLKKTTQIAQKRKKTYAPAYYLWARCLLKKGNIDNAITQLNQVLRDTPSDPEVRVALARALVQKGRAKQAISHYVEALRVRTDNAQWHYELARLLPKENRVDEALFHLTEALALQPDFPEAENNYAWLLATNADAKVRNGKKALETSIKARDLAERRMVLLLDTLAASQAENGDFAAAAKTAEEAIALAKQKGSDDLAKSINDRLELYRTQKPFHEGGASR